MNRKVLIVDDEERVLASFQRSLQFEFEVSTANSGEEALRVLKEQGPFAVLMADMNMPGMNGVRLLQRAQVVAPDTIRIMLTGNADQQTASDAVNKGHVFCFLNKPTHMPDVIQALEEGISRHKALCAERELLENTLGGAINLLAELISLRDPRGFGTAQSLSDYALTLAKMQGITDLWHLAVALRLASIGRLAVPPDLLQKADAGEALSPEERAVIDRIPEMGARLVQNIPRMEEVSRIIRYQAKGFDGSGPPDDGAKGTAIPWGARILSVVKSYVAEEAKGASPEEALAVLQARESAFDPEALFALEELVKPTESAAAPEAAAEAGPVVMELRAVQLKVGLTLASDLHASDGGVVFAKGLRLRTAHLEHLQNMEMLGKLTGPIQVAAG